MDKPLKFTAIYLVILGIITTAWLLLNPGQPDPGAQSFTYIIGSNTRELILAAGFLVSGIGLLKYQLWARKVGLVALALAFFYGGNVIGWNWSEGRPTTSIIVLSYAVSFILFGIWFLILYRDSTIAQLTRQDSAPF